MTEAEQIEAQAKTIRELQKKLEEREDLEYTQEELDDMIADAVTYAKHEVTAESDETVRRVCWEVLRELKHVPDIPYRATSHHDTWRADAVIERELNQ